MSRRGTRCNSPAEFPEPHRFGIWWSELSFNIYENLSLVKTAITNDCDSHGQVRRDIRVFEHDGEEWTLVYHLVRGDNKMAHELWKGRAPQSAGVSEAAVQKAIASIMGQDNG